MGLFAADDRRTVALLAQVAVERSVDLHPDGLTYAVPAELADLRAGERVRVPLGRGNAPTEGIVVRTMAPDAAAGVPAARLKFVESRSGSRRTTCARWA
jgi:primosomal protein N'